MSLNRITIENDSTIPMLNIGCGRTYHADWINVDLESSDSNVISHDVTKGIPFQDCKFKVVYHSHILEHLEPNEGAALIAECFRVLQPGGILRIVVPDLERIAKLYLETHEQAWTGNETSKVNYNWMKLELLDQLVRTASGGQMGRYMASREIKNSDFVRSRVGDELSVCQTHAESLQPAQSLFSGMAQSTLRFRRRLVRRLVKLILGKDSAKAFDEGLFRSQGEIHRWMYDRYSLRELTEATGFVDFRVCQADESEIADYSKFELDSAGGFVRKPDSIFIECQKPISDLGNGSAEEIQQCDSESAAMASSVRQAG